MSDDQYRRLRWRCRRGMLELDVLLSAYLDGHYAAMNAAERLSFERFLLTPDALLFDWCSGVAQPQDPELKQILINITQYNDF